MRRGVVILDRDGVVNHLVARPNGLPEAPLAPQDVRLIEGAAAQLRRLRDAGWWLACVTNQPGAAKAECSLADLVEVHATVTGLLLAEGIRFDTQRMCTHHPDGVPGGLLTGPCSCRKPAPGMLLAVLSELGADPAGSWMVGDTDADVLAGRSAGLSTVLIENPASGHKRGRSRPMSTAGGLPEAVDIILGESPCR